VRAVWQTVRMTNQPNQQRPHREDYKVQRLVQRTETELALQAKTKRSEPNKLEKLAVLRRLTILRSIGLAPTVGVCALCDRVFTVP
jgi:hypothetical protein